VSPDDLRLDDRVLAVTGAAMGIGLATARRAAGLGARVAVLDVRAGPPDLFFAECDVSDPGAVTAAFDRVRRELGPVTVLVNNAGIAPTAVPFEELTTESWRKTLAINLDGVFLSTQAALPQIREAGGGRGAIVNVASVAGKLRSLGSTVAYSASKGGVIAFTRHLAAMLAPEGIRVLAVNPGIVNTPVLDRQVATLMAAEGLDQEAALEQLRRRQPRGRFTEPEEIAALVAYLASDSAALLSGTSVDAGGQGRAL